MKQRLLRNMQTQLSLIIIFGKTFSKSKLLFQILPLNRTLLQRNSFRRTCHVTLSTCKTRLMIRTRQNTHSTRNTCLPTRSTHFFACIFRLFTRSTRLSIRLFTCSNHLSTRSISLPTHSICLSTRSTLGTISRSFCN